MQPLQLFLIVCVVAFTGVAAVLDWRTRRVPNVLTVSAFAAGVAFQTIAGAMRGGWGGAGSGLVASLAGFATGFAILLVLWLIGGGGGGDVKLMGAVGAWLGAEQTLYVFIVSVLIIGLVTPIWWLSRSGYQKMKGRKSKKSAKAGRTLVPYGVPLAVATWCVLAYTTIKP